MAQLRDYADLSTLRALVNNIKSKFAPLSHKHTKSDITDLTIPSKTSELTNDSGYVTKTTSAGTDLGLVKSGGDVTISNGTITVKDDSHAHVIANVDGLQGELDSKVPNTRTVNGNPLSTDITLNAIDIPFSRNGAAAPKSEDIDMQSSTGFLDNSKDVASALLLLEENVASLENNKSDIDHAHNYLPLSGGHLTGDLTGQYLTGTWLRTTSATELESVPKRYPVFDGSGWLYYRSSENTKKDLGIDVIKSELDSKANKSDLGSAASKSVITSINDVSEQTDMQNTIPTLSAVGEINSTYYNDFELKSNLKSAAYADVVNSFNDDYKDNDVASMNAFNEMVGLVSVELENTNQSIKNRAISLQGSSNGELPEKELNYLESTVVASLILADYRTYDTSNTFALSNEGDFNKPIFMLNGRPQECSHTLDASVPEDAKFTDTTYEVATETTDGLMRSEDKIKLNGIESGANKTVIDSSLSSTSKNPVQNKIVNEKFNSNLADAKVYADNILVQAKNYSNSNLADAKVYADNIRTIPIIKITSENGINFTGSYNDSWSCNNNACFINFQSDPLDNSELTININNNGDYKVFVPTINGSRLNCSSRNFKFYIGREYLFIFDGLNWNCLSGISLDIDDINAISYRKEQILTIDEKEIARNNIGAEVEGASATALVNAKTYTDTEISKKSSVKIVRWN